MPTYGYSYSKNYKKLERCLLNFRKEYFVFLLATIEFPVT